MKTIRKDFIFGIVIVVPLASIFWLIDLSVQALTGPMSQLAGFQLNNLNGILLSLGVVWFIGFIARLIVNRSIFPKIEALIVKVPIISLVYRSLRQIASILVKEKQRFLATVFVEYPSKGIWSMGFLTNDHVTCMVNKNGNRLISNAVAVFIPSTPNPMNGMFVFVDESQIEQTQMTVEDGIKCLMSAGMITPEIKIQKK